MSSKFMRFVWVFLAMNAVLLAVAKGDDDQAKGTKEGAAARKPGVASKAKKAESASPKPKKPSASSPKGVAANKPVAAKPVSFMRDIAPIMVENCTACHNPRKSESKYVMTTFAQLAKGGQQGEGINLEPGAPDESRFVELIRLDGNPRMPFKQDPLPMEKIALVERWVTEGAKYDGNSPGEDWTILLRKTQPVAIPPAYSVTMPITALQFNREGTAIAASGFHEITFWKTADGKLDRRMTGLAERIYDIAYSPDGKWLATASGDPGVYGIAKLWLAEPGGGGKPVRDLAETQDVVFAVAFSPDSKKIATAGAIERSASSRSSPASCCHRSKTTPTGSSVSLSPPTASG